MFFPAGRAHSPPFSFVPHCAQRSGGPFLFHRLRSPHTGAPCVGRRTRGAAQMGRGGFAAEKRTGRWSGPREKRQGHRESPPDWKQKWAPGPQQSLRKNPPSKKKGFTGEHGSIPRRAVRGGDPNGMDSGRSIPGAPAVLRGTGRAGKSRAARGAVPHCISAEMPRLWGCRGCFLASGGAEGIVTPDDFSLVPPGGTISFSKKEMVGPTVPRLEGGSLPSRARGAEYSALGSAFERSAALGRKEKLGPLCGKKVVRLSPRKKNAPQAEASGAAVIHFFKRNCGKSFYYLYWGYLMAACAAARRAMGTRKGEQDT